MKLQFISTFLNFLYNNKVKIACILVSIIVAVGIFAFINYSAYKQSPLHSYEKFQAAVLNLNLEDLARMVNFRNISEHLAKETAKVFPFFHKGPYQIQELSNIFQTSILRALKTKPESSEDALIADPKELLAKPVYIIPKDLITQLMQSMTLRQTDDRSALITMNFKHHLFKETFTIVLNMRKILNNWEIYDIINADELVDKLFKILEKRLNDKRNLLIKENDNLIKLMYQTMDLQSCTASAGLISDKKTLLIVFEIMARNKTNLTVKSVNALVRLYNQKNEFLLERRLNTATQTGPSADFSHRWTLELDGTQDLGQKILNGGPLHCVASWRVMSLSNSRVIHAENPPKPLGQCPKHSDPHVEGLCDLPIFKDLPLAPAEAPKKAH